MKRVLIAFVTLMVGASLACAAGNGYVQPGQLKQWLETGEKMVIVDIQEPAAFEKHHLAGAIETNAYPVKSQEERQRLNGALAKIAATEDDVVIVCPRGGGGAENTYDYLKAQGVPEERLLILEKGMEGWPYPELTVGGR